MNRSKSAGAPTPSKAAIEEIRAMCKQIAPYITHEWREVCEELGIADDILDELEATHVNAPMSELAFCGLCKWIETIGRGSCQGKLQKVIKVFGLRRADEQLRRLSEKRRVPYMGRPETVSVTHEGAINKQAKQKALADRLSRPKSNRSAESDSSKQKKKTVPQVMPGVNPLAVQVAPSKPTDKCEVKLKVNVRGVQRNDREEVEQTRDDFKSTKDDFKSMCFTFVKLVLKNRRVHFNELKEHFAFNGISLQSINQVGFNINIFILCSTLGAFEILYQNYSSGRLKKIIQNILVTRDHLVKLNARQLELAVDMDEGMLNKYRDILIVRGPAEENVLHPVDAINYFQCDDDAEEVTTRDDIILDNCSNFNLHTWQQKLHDQILLADNKFKEIEDSIKDLLLVIRIARKEETPEMTCLQDVINCYHHLNFSKSVVAQSSRSNIVHEYLTVVNFIRIIVKEVSENLLPISFDETLHPNACETFHRLLAQLEDMLLPGYLFEKDESVTNTHVMTGLEKEMFGSFLCYLPKLLRLLHSLHDTLSLTTNADDCDENENFSESTEHNDSGIALSKEENNPNDYVQDNCNQTHANITSCHKISSDKQKNGITDNALERG